MSRKRKAPPADAQERVVLKMLVAPPCPDEARKRLALLYDCVRSMLAQSVAAAKDPAPHEHHDCARCDMLLVATAETQAHLEANPKAVILCPFCFADALTEDFLVDVEPDAKRAAATH